MYNGTLCVLSRQISDDVVLVIAPTMRYSRPQQILQAVSVMGFQILATTRKEAAIPASPGWRSIAIPCMDEDVSLRLLQKCSGALSDVPRQPALQVSQLIDGFFLVEA